MRTPPDPTAYQEEGGAMTTGERIRFALWILGVVGMALALGAAVMVGGR